MSIKLGHASIDERGKISGGASGDGTGKEVCTRNFYMHSKGWYALRAKDANVAEQIAKCMEDACENPCIGYDQGQRLTLFNAVKGNGFKCDKNSLKTKVETDCSALVRVCLAFAGVSVGNFNTANEKSVILASKAFTEISCASDGSNLKRGDILVTKTKGHTVIVLTNGTAESEEYDMKTIQKGSKGNAVKVWQIILGFTGSDVDGSFGSKTESATKTWQKKKGLKVDGVVGKNSWKTGLESL